MGSPNLYRQHLWWYVGMRSTDASHKGTTHRMNKYCTVVPCSLTILPHNEQEKIKPFEQWNFCCNFVQFDLGNSPSTRRPMTSGPMATHPRTTRPIKTGRKTTCPVDNSPHGQLYPWAIVTMDNSPYDVCYSQMMNLLICFGIVWTRMFFFNWTVPRISVGLQVVRL